MKLRKKPIEVEAIRYDGHNLGEISDWLYGLTEKRSDFRVSLTGSMQRDLLEVVVPLATLQASPGDWIVRDERGSFDSYSRDEFAATYEPAE